MVKLNIKFSGIVLHSTAFGDNDLILTLLTNELGKIDAIAKGARKMNKAPLYTQPFSYSEFVAYKGKNLYIINSADFKDAFYELRNDLRKLSLAQYFTETDLFIPKDIIITEGQLLLKLLLNSLYLLCKGQISETIIKIVYEIKYAVYTGFTPQTEACVSCQANNPYIWNFDDGFYCGECGMEKLNEKEQTNNNNTETSIKGIKLSSAMVLALRHIIKNEGATGYAFKISEASLEYLSSVTERYLAHHLDTQFKSLGYYKSVYEIEQSISKLKSTGEKLV